MIGRSLYGIGRNWIGNASALSIFLFALSWVAGCQSQVSETTTYGTAAQPNDGTHPVVTAHYLIHTTIEYAAVPIALGNVMEAAWPQYRKLAPTVTPSDQPLEMWVFGDRRQWAQYTQVHTGAESSRYLQINRGGYTLRDVCVLYYLGPETTYSVAAHEGWHQFVARNFAMRPPPFLEEGLATTFETITWQGSMPAWSGDNPKRRRALAAAYRQTCLWPLEKLVTMHAGDVIGLNALQIEAFYAQDWAFARFLSEAENGRFRPVLDKLLADCAAGTAYNGLPASSAQAARLRMMGAFDTRAVRPLLERYFNMPLAEIDNHYEAYLRNLVR